MSEPERFHDSTDLQHNLLINDIKRGLLVPVLGAEINLCGRPLRNDVPVPWTEAVNGVKFPPSTCELASYLLDRVKEERRNLDPALLRLLNNFLERQLRNPQDSMSAICLANVCQYIQFIDKNILDLVLPDLLHEESNPTPVHNFLLRLAQYKPNPGIAEDRPYPCIVTACFDQALEQHLRKNQVPFHLVAFVLSEKGGVFQYTPPGRDPEECSQEINCTDIGELMEGFKEHAVVIKLNGGMPIVGKRNFAITEDHYIDYLSHQGIKGSLPEMLLAKLTKRGKRENSHLLFLGYSLRHWNLRVILRRIWSENLSNQNKRWTVVMEQRFSRIDTRFWMDYGLQPSDLTQIDSLEHYIRRLTDKLEHLPHQSSRSFSSLSVIPFPRVPSPTLEKPKRDGVFCSYSHKDEQWLNELVKMLAPVKDKLKLWNDHNIQPSARWKDEIEKALTTARAAVLLVSTDFLDSEFIQKHELPPLLDAAQKDGCQILWVKLTESLVDETPISEYQALNTQPLIDLTSTSDINKALFSIATKIREALKPQLAT